MAIRTTAILELEGLERQFSDAAASQADDRIKVRTLCVLLNKMSGVITHATQSGTDYVPDLREYVIDFLTRNDLAPCIIDKAFGEGSAMAEMNLKMGQVLGEVSLESEVPEYYRL
tara:strand:- start:61 stop:405 length:345 start_codon:yes stop_codon:yes gene_type:complete